MNDSEQSLNQKKIALAQSEHAGTVIALMKDCISQTPLVADSQWATIVNTIKMDTESTMLRNMVDLIDRIKKGSLVNTDEL